MTEAELAEGRRLLDDALKIANGTFGARLREWLWKNLPALLARREEIAREAVREFAAEYKRRCNDYGWEHSPVIFNKLLLDCSVTLDEKP